MSRMRIRTVKPEMFRNEAIGALTRDARLTFIGLITMADDAGRLRYTPSAVLGHVFPFDEDLTPQKVRRLVGELAAQALIETYENDGRTYLWLTGWERNQKINRVSASQLPKPPNPLGSWYPHDGNPPPNSVIDSVNGSVNEVQAKS